MHIVYLIQNSESGEHYYGYTTDLKRRIDEHNRGSNTSTRRTKGTWVLIYAEAYKSKKDALIRESKLKDNGNAKRGLLQRLQNSFLENKN
jgi:putative endonuclease